ncbi:MAG: hypothetical protein ACXWPS_02395 [Ktedonobacteraceae bacterium]
MRPQSDSSNTFNRRIVFTIISIVLVLLVVVGVLVVKDVTTGNQTHVALSPTAIATQNGMVTVTAIPNVAASPLLFGTNLGLFTGNDQVVSSASTRALMQQMHIRIVRIPTRTHLSNEVGIQAFQAVKSIGAVPLIVLTGVRDPNVVDNDTRIIQDANSVFGNSLVYYEFGNEDDWNGVTIERYTTGWNTYIPQFKHLTLNGKFIGPVSYQYDHNNLTTFLQGANPRPDAISWHEYTCSYREPMDNCLTNLDRWSTHIQDGRSVMQATLGTELPIMITEWNYAADQSIQHNGLPFDDGKYNNASFITAWTTKAMDILAANKVYASMQYSVTNTALPLINDNNALTLQGVTFQSLYQKMVHDPSGN